MTYAELAKKISKMSPKQKAAKVSAVVDGDLIVENLKLNLITKSACETLDCLNFEDIGTHILSD